VSDERWPLADRQALRDLDDAQLMRLVRGVAAVDRAVDHYQRHERRLVDVGDLLTTTRCEHRLERVFVSHFLVRKAAR